MTDLGPVGPRRGTEDRGRIGRETYDEYARLYDSIFDAITEDIDFWAKLAPQRRVCEVGCGTGRILRRLTGARSLIGIDPSRLMLERAASRVQTSTELRLGALEDLPAQDNDFDLVICPRGAYSHQLTDDQLARGSAELGRVTRRNGLVVIDVPNFAPSDPALSGETELAHVADLAHEDRRIAVYQESDFDPTSRIVTLRQYFLDPAPVEGPQVTEIELRTKVLTLDEIMHFLAAAELATVDVMGDYTGDRYRSSSPRIIVHARNTKSGEILAR